MKILTLLMIFSLGASTLLAAEVKSSDVRKFKRRLTLAIKGQRGAALNELIGELAGLDDPKVVVLIPPAAIGVPSATNYNDAVTALAAFKNEESIDALVALLKKTKDFRERVLLLEAFGKRSEAATLQAVLENLEHKVPQIQIAAIQASAARRQKEAIPALIDLLEERWKVRDRIWIESRVALLKLTGQDFDTIEDWRKFWEGNGATFDPKTVGEDTDKTNVKVKKTEDSVEFFGTEVFSRNLVFVIDVSGSMLMYDDTGTATGKDIEQEGQRLNRAKKQLIQALRKLKRGALFNIVTFNNKIVPWQKKMQRATGSTIGNAIKFVNRFKANDATHTDDALKEAFKDLSVDTIVLLSDGAPTRRDTPDSMALINKIIRWVKDTNSSRKVRIDTFGFEGVGSWPEKNPWGRRPPPIPTPEQVKVFVEFLKTLATDSGGTYRPIK